PCRLVYHSIMGTPVRKPGNHARVNERDLRLFRPVRLSDAKGACQSSIRVTTVSALDLQVAAKNRQIFLAEETDRMASCFPKRKKDRRNLLLPIISLRQKIVKI